MSISLRADNVSVSFDGLRALSDVTLSIPLARVTGLIGPNGAGKTTMVNVLTGFQVPSNGQVYLGDKDVSQVASHKLRRLGVARTFQGGRMFKDLTVLDNLEVTGVGLGLSRRMAAEQALAMLDWIGISHLTTDLAGSLPYTDERRVAIARSLMMEPDFLLLDEPAAGMSAHEADDLCGIIGRIVSEKGCGVLLIEHNIGLVLKTCDHIHVLDSGELIEEGDPEFIKASEKVRHAYMGTQGDVDISLEKAVV
jgi:branched-chain amino acid transport system ATP-binding protein